ncbi:MAG: aspartate/glutamate racemase family protein [Verrucomicrobiia bacterium]
MPNILANEKEKQAKSFLQHVRQLEGAGATAIGVTSIAAHFCIDELKALSPLPIVDAVIEVREEIERKELGRVGILGTRGAMASKLFGSIASEKAVLPQGDDLERVHNAYIGMATSGHATNEQREVVFSTGTELCRNGGADSIVLAGTDLFLAFEGHDCGFPTIDCAVVHSEALFRSSQEGVGS